MRAWTIGLCVALWGCGGPSEPLIEEPEIFGEAGKADSFADEPNVVTLYAMPAPVPLDWSGPGAFARSFFETIAAYKLGLSKQSLGHTGISIACDRDKPSRTGFQGSIRMTDDGATLQKMIFTEKVGLGALLYPAPGRIETGQELISQVRAHLDASDGEVTFMQWAISQDTCHQLIAYVDAFRENDIAKAYSPGVDPLRKEGAVCSSFSMSVLRLAGLTSALLEGNFSVAVRVPIKYVGGVLNPGNEVSVTGTTFSFGEWAQPEEAGFDLRTYDPTYVFNTITRWVKTPPSGTNYRRGVMGKTRGILSDAKDVAPDPRLLAGRYFE